MKRVLVCILILAGYLWSAYLTNQEVTITDATGKKHKIFASGDEFYSWLHTDDGYTLIQDHDGFLYYGELKGDKVVSSGLRYNFDSPEVKGLSKWIKIPAESYYARKTQFENVIPKGSRAPHTGVLNNLAVYIKFSDDVEFSYSRQYFDDKFNPEDGISMKAYYKEVSYGNLIINTTHYPESEMSTNLSYTDSHPRGYYQPYNATMNPEGYTNDSQRTTREHVLLKNAIEAIADQVPADLNIDGDNDGKVDNVCFIINGSNDGWSDLLWAHRWVLYTQNALINGKKVYDYTFQPVTQNEVRTLCHEMFHALGAPDLYHYYDNTHISPAGPWDLMEQGFVHMGAYMKWKYAGQKWIREIPEITESGIYTLNPLACDSNNVYKIPSPYSDSEYFVVEYRKREGSFEGNVPGSGLLVYRINPIYDGNADNYGYDEVYIYRPGGTLNTNGYINSAYFSQTMNRTAINDTTSPRSFLSEGEDGGLDISEIGTPGETISFKVTITASSDISAPDISVTSPGTFALNEAALITATVTDESAITSVDLYYGLGDEEISHKVTMTLNGSVYEAEIPAQSSEASANFYIEASDEFENTGKTEESTIFWQENTEFTGDSFENYADFSLEFGQWSQIDNDGLNTYGFEETDFTNSGYTGSFIVFNPKTTSPEMTDESILAYDGDKFVACFDAVPDNGEGNNDWLISPNLDLTNCTKFSFWAKSYTDSYGLERMKIGVATKAYPLASDFTIVSEDLNTPGKDYVEVPVEWTKYTFDLSDYTGTEDLHVGINCVSNDAFILMLDDFSLSSGVGISEDALLPEKVSLKQNYPNPFNPETTISYTLNNTADVKLKVFNSKGQLVKELVNRKQNAGLFSVKFNALDLNSGVYFYQLSVGKKSFTKKMILMK